MSNTEIDAKLADQIENLHRAWTLIIDQFGSKAESVAREEGPGFSLFHMLPKPRDSGSNCTYRYIPRVDKQEEDGVEHPWWTFINNSPQKDKILEKYDPSTNFLVVVAVPGAEENSIFQNFRLFRFGSREEIDLS